MAATTRGQFQVIFTRFDHTENLKKVKKNHCNGSNLDMNTWFEWAHMGSNGIKLIQMGQFGVKMGQIRTKLGNIWLKWWRAQCGNSRTFIPPLRFYVKSYLEFLDALNFDIWENFLLTKMSRIVKNSIFRAAKMVIKTFFGIQNNFYVACKKCVITLWKLRNFQHFSGLLFTKNQI